MAEAVRVRRGQACECLCHRGKSWERAGGSVDRLSDGMLQARRPPAHPPLHLQQVDPLLEHKPHPGRHGITGIASLRALHPGLGFQDVTSAACQALRHKLGHLPCSDPLGELPRPCSANESQRSPRGPRSPGPCTGCWPEW